MTPSQTNEAAARDDADDLRRRAADGISAARALAEAGRRAPLLGGGVYVTWGAFVAAGFFVNWAIVVGAIDVAPWAIAISWFALTAAAGLISSRQRAADQGRAGAAGVGNAVSAAVWRAAGFFLGVFALTLFAVGIASPLDPGATDTDRGRAIASGFSFFTPVSFGVYAIAMEASAAASQSRWLRSYSRLSFGAMAATIVTAGSPHQFLIAAASVIVVLVLPGALLIRRARGKSDG